jgi:hypothetical protein
MSDLEMGMKQTTNFLRSAALLLTSLAILAGCGGGGGDGDSDSITTSTSGLSVTVSDTYGAKVAGATVEATVGASTRTGTTNDQGVALLVFRGIAGPASGSVSRDTFISKPIAVALTTNQLTELAVTLDRATSAAGGSLTSRSGVFPTVSPDARSMSFEVELVVVDGNSQPIGGLTAADFVLRACTPDPANDRVDCVRGAATSFDAAYVPVTGTPEVLALIPGATAEPYAAALMLDQSGSIYDSDPTGARLYSAKAFLDGLGMNDRVLLSAFADGAALIPDTPLTVYPPFRDAGTVSSAPSYFSTLDSLATLVGGGTPLYAALDSLGEQVIADSSLPAGIAKSVVIFTDGDDTTCGDPELCRVRRQQSIDLANAKGIRVFTIGLTSGVNFESLGELANATDGAFLFAESPEQLIPLYGSVGRLLSLSLPTYRLKWTVQASSTGVFQTGNAILGRVTVTAGTSTFDVPFIVGIP